jgi:hypothetical protein
MKHLPWDRLLPAQREAPTSADLPAGSRAKIALLAIYLLLFAWNILNVRFV